MCSTQPATQRSPVQRSSKFDPPRGHARPVAGQQHQQACSRHKSLLQRPLISRSIRPCCTVSPHLRTAAVAAAGAAYCLSPSPCPMPAGAHVAAQHISVQHHHHACSSVCRQQQQQKQRRRTPAMSGPGSRSAGATCPRRTHSLTSSTLCQPNRLCRCARGGLCMQVNSQLTPQLHAVSCTTN